MPNYTQFYNAIQTVVCYASRYGTAQIVLTDIKLGDYLTALVVDVSGGPIVDAEPVEYGQFFAALETIASYCQEQKIPESTDSGVILGEGVVVTMTTEWAVMGAFDQTAMDLTATRTVGEVAVSVAIENGRFMKSNVVS